MDNREKAEGIQAICFTDAGETLGMRLKESIPLTLHRSSSQLPVRAWTTAHFKTAGALLYIGAAGIAVRSIAPYVKSKVQDPAVLVMDEKGQFVIPILSGHLGGANDLARSISACCGAVPVLTTATDVRGYFAVDEWAKKNRALVYNPGKIVCVSSAILGGGTVTMRSAFPVSGEVPEGVRVLPPEEDLPDETSGGKNIPDRYAAAVAKSGLPDTPDGKGNSAGKSGQRTEGADIVLDVHTRKTDPRNETGTEKKDTLYLIPRILVLGIGCRKGISAAAAEEAFAHFLLENHLRKEAFVSAASIDLKKDEPGLLEFCGKHGFALKTFSADELEKAPGVYTASAFVRKVTGTDNVCERSAVLSSGGKLLVRKTAENGVTLAAAQMPYYPSWG